MTTYARIRGGIVAELFTPPTGVAITACFAPSMTWAECYGTPGVAPGWAATEVAGAWTFSAPPAPPAPTLAQQAQALLAGSLTIASTSTPALNGSYAIDPATQVHMQAEMLCVTVNGAFADATSSLAWPDAGGTARHGTARHGTARHTSFPRPPSSRRSPWQWQPSWRAASRSSTARPRRFRAPA